jgi:nucleoid DNA-binding protein
MAKKSDKPLSKTDILNALADATGQSRKEVGAVLEALEGLIASNVSKGPGVFNLPGLLKIYVHTRQRPKNVPAAILQLAKRSRLQQSQPRRSSKFEL